MMEGKRTSGNGNGMLQVEKLKLINHRGTRDYSIPAMEKQKSVETATIRNVTGGTNSKVVSVKELLDFTH